MLSNAHELAVDLFRQHPGLITRLLGEVVNDVELAKLSEIREEPTDFADVPPATFRADAAFVLGDELVEQRGVLVEVQLSVERRKQWTWLVYLANQRARLERPVMLLVVCLDRATARWCAKPVETGHPGLVLAPVVVGPADLPVITDPSQVAAEPHLATLAALAHRSDPKVQSAVLQPLLTTLLAQRDEQLELYADYVVSGLDEPDRHYWEVFMTQLMEDYKEAYRRKYEAVGEAKALLRMLAARGVPVPEAASERITSCTDTVQLERWISRAVSVTTVEELFAD